MSAQLITDFALPDASWKEAQTSVPKAGELVRYRTAQYQLFGYLTGEGRWVAIDGEEEAQPVRAWKEVHAPASTWPERVA